MPDTSEQESTARRAYVSPLRERQAQETRESILDALTQLLERRGADEITTREVAREAGVAERSVYRHFPDRAALVEGLTARLEERRTRPQATIETYEDLKLVVVEAMSVMEDHPIEVRAEALFSADPRRYSTVTREHTSQFNEAVRASFPDLDEHQQRGVAAIVRLLISGQAWLRMREEFGIGGDAGGPLVAWVLGAIEHEIGRGNPPPSAGRSQRSRRPAARSTTTTTTTNNTNDDDNKQSS